MGVTIREAAKHFGMHPATVRRWIRDGCPCLETGSVGPGHGSRLDLQAVEGWLLKRRLPMLATYAERDGLAIVAVALYDSLKRDALSEKTGITRTQAEHVALLIYERAYRNRMQQPLEFKDLPDALKLISANVVASRERKNNSSSL